MHVYTCFVLCMYAWLPYMTVAGRYLSKYMHMHTGMFLVSGWSFEQDFRDIHASLIHFAPYVSHIFLHAEYIRCYKHTYITYIPVCSITPYAHSSLLPVQGEKSLNYGRKFGDGRAKYETVRQSKGPQEHPKHEYQGNQLPGTYMVYQSMYGVHMFSSCQAHFRNEWRVCVCVLGACVPTWLMQCESIPRRGRMKATPKSTCSV
jgi:hypothetical protein